MLLECSRKRIVFDFDSKLKNIYLNNKFKQCLKFKHLLPIFAARWCLDDKKPAHDRSSDSQPIETSLFSRIRFSVIVGRIDTHAPLRY